MVTAGGVRLVEGSDYSVDYNAGEVTILNQSIIDAGTAVNVSLESQSDYGQQRKTMFGLNWEYDFSKNFMIGGTFMHLSEQSLTTKVNMGAEPLNNTIWGLNMSWKKESQWLTNMLDKIPIPASNTTFAYFVFCRVCTVNSWSEPGHTRPCIVFRRLRKYKEYNRYKPTNQLGNIKCTL